MSHLDITIKFRAQESDLRDILTTAWESGLSESWLREYKPTIRRDENTLVSVIILNKMVGEGIETARTNRVTVAALVRAIEDLFKTPAEEYVAVKRDIIANMDELGGTDAETADVLLQFVLFGEEAYS